MQPMRLFDGSRYWLNAFVFQVLAFALSAYVVRTAGAAGIANVVGPMFLMLGGVGSTLFGVMGWVKKGEREPESQAAYLERLKFESENGGQP